MKTEVWTLCPSLEVGTKHPWKELQRQSLELRQKDGPSRDRHIQGSISYQSEWLRSKTHMTAHAAKDVEKEEHSSIVGGIESLYNPSGNQSGGFLRKLDIVLLEDLVIPLLGIYPEDVPTCKKDTCSTMFIAALFIIARSWKEPRCPSREEWIQKMWYIYTMEYYSAI